MNIQSYVTGEWYNGQGNGVEVVNAVNGDFIGSVTSDGMEFGEVLRHAREAGGPASARDDVARACPAPESTGRNICWNIRTNFTRYQPGPAQPGQTAGSI